jgi:glycosyltransferase involved in cell wall biosynthesis
MINNSQILVSVNMITYLHGQYIKEAIEGVLMQECDFNFELIIADDCSPDNTPEIVNEIINNNPNGYKIKYFRHKKNIGMQANSMFAKNKSYGKYVAFCEGDDYWTDKYKLNSQIQFLENNTDYIFCTHKYSLYFQNKNYLDNKIYPLRFDRYTSKDIVDINKTIFLQEWLTMPLTTVVIKKHYDLVSEKSSLFKFFRDFHFFYLLLDYGKGACLDINAGVYRIHDGGVFSSISQIEKSNTSFKIYEELYLFSRDYRLLTLYWESIVILFIRGKGFDLFKNSFINKFSVRDQFLLLGSFVFYLRRKLNQKFNV